MLLESNQTAQALNVDEKTLLRWIRKDNLPAELVNGQYRIDPVDLLEWATERRIKVDPMLYRMGCPPDSGTATLPTLSRALEVGGVHFGVPGADKEAVLAAVVARLNLPPQVNPDFLLQALLGREALGTTAVGDAIAIPHVRNPILVRLPYPKVSLSYLAHPVDFGAPDGKPVDTLFTLITSDIKMHLHLLSRLAFCLNDPRLRRVLHPSSPAVAAISAIAEIEAEIR